MKIMRILATSIVAAAVIWTIVGRADEATSEPGRRIAVWGSSVANGVGDEFGQGGNAGRLEKLLEQRGWEVFNQSRNGDNTTTIAPRFDPGDSPQPDIEYLTAVDPDYVLIGLSLGNEGIAQCQLGQAQGCTSTMQDAEAIFEQFATGLEALIARARVASITPIVALPYARSDFWEREYEFTRRMILLINSWDVPSINMLGAVDDGQGRWARGLWGDPFHPNAAGHTEMFHAVVPTLFAALQAGKPTPVNTGDGYARVRDNIAAPMTFDVEDTIRSFTLTFMLRPDSDGIVAAVSGQVLDANYTMLRRAYGEFGWDTENIELEPTDDRFTATIEINADALAYSSSAGNSITSPTLRAESWHYVTLTHYVGRGETLFYVDGHLVGSIAERLQPERFVLGGPGVDVGDARSAQADYRNWMIHRAGSTQDEVAALHGGTLLQASLEVYAPLAGDGPAATLNLAQSLAEIAIDPAVRSVSADPAPVP
jgi:lysophospholipase L1-like esterase